MDGAVDTKFQQNYVAALHAFSPTFAALHATRARHSARPVTLSPLHCSRCGHLAVTTRIASVSASSRRTRTNTSAGQKRQKYKRVIRRTCTACSFVDSTPIAQAMEACTPRPHPASSPEAASLAPVSTDRIIHVPATPNSPSPDLSARGDGNGGGAGLKSEARVPVRDLTPALTPTEPSPGLGRKSNITIPVQSGGLSKRTKKSGLQEMLARSKEAAKRTKDEGQAGGGLAAFLGGL
ncbi:hypothetical protein M0805_005467 [Coniferiporia weirii]|nr:hypothetical protein M0805_005467 [Coniferiporia weirii]